MDNLRFSLAIIAILVFLIFFSVFKIFTSVLDEPQVEAINLPNEIEISGESNLIVYIAGAVENPGVYSLTDPLYLVDLIEIAGGLTMEADLIIINESLNLATRVFNEDHFYIPFKLDKELNLSNLANSKISLNSASKSELETLPGVGVSTAEKIIESRPYSNIEDLKNVSGIGEATFEKLKSLISI